MEYRYNHTEIVQLALRVADTIERNEGLLVSAMLEYEPYGAVKDQLERSVSALRNISVEFDNFDFKLNKYAAFLPLNLPLYSIVLFGIIPSFYSDRVIVRAPKLAINVVKSIENILNLHALGISNVEFSSDGRESFLSKIYDSDAVCFTGTHKNSLHVRKALNSNCIFLFNGAGINPVVVGRNADIALAVDKCVEVKVFNSGQDCAGPDAILVDHEVFDRFMELLSEKVGSIKVESDYKAHPTVKVGPLLDGSGSIKLARFFDKNKSDIVLGGRVDILSGVVYPTIMVSDLTSCANYTELFSPVWYVHKYKSEEELSSYFAHDTYKNHCMYVSVFGGDSIDMKIFGESNILSEQIILDVENGNHEYGGTGVMASSLSYDKKTIPKAILLSRDISIALNSRKSTVKASLKQVQLEDLLL